MELFITERGQPVYARLHIYLPLFIFWRRATLSVSL